MKIFISQKTRDKTKEEIIKERNEVEQRFLNTIFNKLKIESQDRDMHMNCVPNGKYLVVDGYNNPIEEMSFIESYNHELKFKDPITSLSHSLSMLAVADIVLVPKESLDYVVDMNAIHHSRGKRFCEYWTILSPEFIKQYIKGCEFEFLIAKSYGKKVYTYDDNYTFEEV